MNEKVRDKCTKTQENWLNTQCNKLESNSFKATKNIHRQISENKLNEKMLNIHPCYFKNAQIMKTTFFIKYFYLLAARIIHQM